jgi:iron complex transport system substrate-binding protein
MKRRLIASLALWLLIISVPGWSAGRIITDGIGRKVEIPVKVERLIASGSGALRLITYLRAQDRIVAVDDMEKQRPQFDARPYALANPQFKSYPLFGEFRGHDNPELILSLDPQPQVIIKTYSVSGYDPLELQQKTGIPVIVVNYGDLGAYRPDLYQALRICGQVLAKEKRAEKLISYFDASINDLRQRTRDIPPARRFSCFVGGIAHRGPHGFQSTEPGYPPFTFVGTRNLTFDPALKEKLPQHSNIAKEKIVQRNPDILFVDLSTLQMGAEAGALYELKTDPAYRSLTAVKTGKVYGLLPYNWYTQNFGSILANAYFIGKVLYPDRFADINPSAKADEIYTFFVGKPVFRQMNEAFGGIAFKAVPLN